MTVGFTTHINTEKYYLNKNVISNTVILSFTCFTVETVSKCNGHNATTERGNKCKECLAFMAPSG